MNRKAPSDIILFLLLAVGVFLWQRTALPPWIGDVFPDQLAAHYIRNGDIESVYASSRTYDAWMAKSLPVARDLGLDYDLCTYMYPPFVAGALVPFSEVSAGTWRDVIFVINVILLFVISYQTVKVCDILMGWRALLWGLVLILLCYPMARATKLSQPVPLLAVIAWIGLIGLRKRKDWMAGIVLGLVTAIKLFPGVIFLLPLLDRRFKPVVIGIAVNIAIYTASVITTGMRLHVLWWETMHEFSRNVIPYWGNQSPLGWLSRAVIGLDIMEGRPTVFPGQWILRLVMIIVFGGITLWCLWKMRGKLTSERFPLSVGLVLSGTLLSVPTAWEHYWLFVLPVLGWAIYREWHQGDSIVTLLWLLGAAFFFLMKLTRFYTPSEWGRIATGSQTVGLILFWAWMVYRSRRDFRPVTQTQALSSASCDV